METKLKKLVIGLGNPGTEFENTYHNVGFLALDAIIRKIGGNEIPAWKTQKKVFSYACEGKTVFIKPLTFMNESGVAVKEALKKFDVGVGEMLVIHDESDLYLGDFKISAGKNAAGHRGIQSIIDHVGSNEFQRVRIGIRPTREKARKKASVFVLSRITSADHETLEKVFEKIEEKLGIRD
jgi:PTH1 family peptidyl-tRNA hydrolase